MTVLCFDPATKTGYAVIEKGKIIASGVVNFTDKSGDTGVYTRAEAFFIGLRKTVEEEHSVVTDVAYENVIGHKSAYAGHRYGGIMACIKLGLRDDSGAPPRYHGYAVSTIKRRFTGDGRADKDAMVAEARRRGHNPKDDNEADAIAIAYLAIEDGIGVENAS